MPRPFPTRLLPLLAAAVLASATLAACDDPLSSRRQPVPEEPARATLFTLEDRSLRDPAAFDLASAREVRPDQSPGWDFALGRGSDGELQFLPRTLVFSSHSSAGLQRLDFAFEEVDAAPGGGYVVDEPVTVEEGAVYAVRSRDDPRVRTSCFRYMKMEVLNVDRDEGRVTMLYLINPNCGRRTLVPGASGEDQDV